MMQGTYQERVYIRMIFFACLQKSPLRSDTTLSKMSFMRKINNEANEK